MKQSKKFGPDYLLYKSDIEYVKMYLKEYDIRKIVN